MEIHIYIYIDNMRRPKNRLQTGHVFESPDPYRWRQWLHWSDGAGGRKMFWRCLVKTHAKGTPGKYREVCCTLIVVSCGFSDFCGRVQHPKVLLQIQDSFSTCGQISIAGSRQRWAGRVSLHWCGIWHLHCWCVACRQPLTNWANGRFTGDISHSNREHDQP